MSDPIILKVEEAFLESDILAYEGSYAVTPSMEQQTLPTGGMRLEEDIVVEPVPGGELATPSIDVSSSGLITAQAGVSESGYIADTDTKSATQQLSTQAGKTVTPTESEQTAVDEHKYTTGKVKVAAVPSDYVGSGIARKDSSSLSASGKRVTAPAGYYAEAAGKDVAGGSATTPATEITANPSISVDANGLITAGVSKTQSITPTVVEGYVENGTAGNVSVSGSATSQLPTDNGSEVTPSTQEQTLNLSGKFMKGNVKVKKIPSEYVVPSGTKQITSNGSAQDVAAYEKVDVNVPNSYAASDEGKVVSNGALVAQTSQTIDENGTYDTTLKNEVVVDVQSGGGTVIASGTFAGNGRHAISLPVGTKMPETDFAFVIHLPKNQEITYVDDSNNQILLWIQYVVPKKTQRFDLSSVANNIKSTNTLGLTVNNGGTITSLNPNGTAAIRVFSRANGYAFAMAGNESAQTISRTATGFNVNVSSEAWMMVFRTGYTYEWEIIYFGDDPTNDIVEIP